MNARDDEVMADPNVNPNDVRGDYGDKIMKELEERGYDPSLNKDPLPDYEELLKLSEAERAELLIHEIGVQVRTTNALEKAGISSVGDLLKRKKVELLGRPNVGQSTIDEIADALAKIKMDHLWFHR